VEKMSRNTAESIKDAGMGLSESRSLAGAAISLHHALPA